MNFDNLFKSRDKSFVRISEAADYFSRCLRENLSIFEINDNDSTVTFLSEKNNFISCEYGFTKGKMTLSDFVVEDLEEVTDDERIDAQVSKEVSDFVASLAENRFDRAEGAFDSVLDSFTSRHRIKETRSKLDKKVARFNAAYSITESSEYKKLEEVAPMLEKFLAESKEELEKNDSFMEGMRLSYLVTEAYDLPRISYEELGKSFIVVPENNKKSLYEMICEKELVRKELLEAKESFSRMWVGNDAVTNLASCIYANDPTVIKNIKAVVKEVPYFALASKTDVYEVLNAVYEVTNPGTISQKDIREFVSKIFEAKKPHKQMVLETLNDKYGINMQNLKFTPSFKGLGEVYSDIMGVIAETAGDGVLHDVCHGFSNFMKKKGGVEVLDVGALLHESLDKAGIEIVADKEAFGIEELSAEISEQFTGDEEQDMDSKDLEKKPKKKKNGKEKGKKAEKVNGDDTEATEPDAEAEKEGGDHGPADANNVVGGPETKKGKGKDKDKKKKLKEEVDVPDREELEAPENGEKEEAFPKAEYAKGEDEEATEEGDIKELVADLEAMLDDIDLSGAELEPENVEEFDEESSEEEATGQEETPA